MATTLGAALPSDSAESALWGECCRRILLLGKLNSAVSIAHTGINARA
jgi:hypothetical protein